LGSTHKVCYKCKLTKKSSEFYSRGGKQKHLLSSRCKDCFKLPEYRHKANLRNKKWYNGKRAELYKRDPKKYLWSVAKQRAKLLGKEFTITPEDIICTGYCPVTGVKLDLETNKLNTSMSLDRVDNSKGYIPGNVVVVSRWANLRKSDMTLGDVQRLLAYMENYLY
jgi:hypothetical protein